MTGKEKLIYFERLQALSLQEVWKGRKTDPQLCAQYYYQSVNLIPNQNPKSHTKSIGLVGYACDAGVARNQGRVGARLAPNAVRQRLAKVAYHAIDKSLFDYGNIKCLNDNLEECQNVFSEEIAKMLNDSVFPIAIGGGHDISLAHYEGILKAFPNDQKPNIGIINFDAHFDLRPITDKANSGTPFNQILSHHKNNVKYMPIGIQPSSNTKELFDIASKYDVSYIEQESCTEANLESICNQIDNYFSESDYIYITIDIDGFNAMHAPGVSAPSPFGLSPTFVVNCLQHIFKFHKVISCDLAECNPLFDIDNRTTTLTARLIDKIISFA